MSAKLIILSGVDSNAKVDYALKMASSGRIVLNRAQFMDALAKKEASTDQVNMRHVMRQQWRRFASSWVSYLEEQLTINAAENPGRDCVVLAAHLKECDRQNARALAEKLGFTPYVVYFPAPKTMTQQQYSQFKALEVPSNPDKVYE